ncbi:MAG: polyprenyl synthetase family protein [Nitrospinae bacterium]|nr:polyprenyl synthetase family protein [Nitrospinota bacterium]MZH46358.1 polyprenyl synthetase family protein [Nitrospinota bacterium]
MDFRDVTQELKNDLTRVEKAINENYKSDVPLIPGISSYLMSCGGKRIRPILTLLGAKLCGRETDDTVVKHGCVVEYIHAATLLHDDVVDETTVRRGKETVNAKWGSDASILVGDFLISRAILILAQDCDRKIIQAVTEATKVLVEGGIHEYTEARNIKVSEKHILDVIHRKTGSMISVSARLGGLLANATEQQETAIISFGDDFGMAFQLMDDALDYNANEAVLGKPPGTDFKEGHVTLPLHHLYHNADRSLKREIEGFIKNENLTEKDLQYVLGHMHNHKSIEYTVNLARFYIDRAKSHLRKAHFPAPEYIEHFDAVADYIHSRHQPDVALKA